MWFVAQVASACVGHVEWWSGDLGWVEVHDGLVFATGKVGSVDDGPPLFAISDDGRAAHRVRLGWTGRVGADRRPTVVLDATTNELRRRGGRRVGAIDLAAGTVAYDGLTVRLDGACTLSEAMLAAVGAVTRRPLPSVPTPL